ncbi:futalosine hydrolase [Salidesulfovibrio onnuriiensis]|uniref:futalosine hydrolase n=1 Tax=Salidesulfovibrio onnuriiensis TaxID=2583823 RepID=UPI0011C8E852|nr:futalosine hydrolase [Salidesulfovibrio onnuriiensis]
MLAFVTATAKEMRAALSGLGAPVVEQGGMVSWKYMGRDWLLCVSGVGLVNAGIMTGRILERGARGVLNAGVAGTFAPDAAPMGSAWLADVEVWPEYGLQREDGSIDPRGIGFPLGQSGGEPVFDRVGLDPRAAAAAMDLSGAQGIPEAAFLSVSAVTGTGKRAQKLRKVFDVRLENMEGFAFALGCAQAGAPFLELRTVSNVVGSRSKEDWNLEGALTALGDACSRVLQAS